MVRLYEAQSVILWARNLLTHFDEPSCSGYVEMSSLILKTHDISCVQNDMKIGLRLDILAIVESFDAVTRNNGQSEFRTVVFNMQLCA